jgi:hypothetical protein
LLLQQLQQQTLPTWTSISSFVKATTKHRSFKSRYVAAQASLLLPILSGVICRCGHGLNCIHFDQVTLVCGAHCSPSMSTTVYSNRTRCVGMCLTAVTRASAYLPVQQVRICRLAGRKVAFLWLVLRQRNDYQCAAFSTTS